MNGDELIRHCHMLPSRQVDNLKLLSEMTGSSVSDWIRKFIDYGMQDRSLNEIIPWMSGSISVRER